MMLKKINIDFAKYIGLKAKFFTSDICFSCCIIDAKIDEDNNIKFKIVNNSLLSSPLWVDSNHVIVLNESCNE